MDPESSIDLLTRARDGDDEALNELLARYLPRLMQWAHGRLPGGARTMLDTGDLVQDAIINALRHLDTIEIRTEGTLQAYLRRAVKNRVIDLYRQRQRRPARDELPEQIASDGASPVEIAIGREALESYERALDTLSAAEHAAVVLRVEFGLDYPEIARQLQKSPDAARMMVTRALAKVAAEMRNTR